MKYPLSVLLIMALSACATPPKPAQCTGEFKPVNPQEQHGIQLSTTEKETMCDIGSGGHGHG